MEFEIIKVVPNLKDYAQELCLHLKTLGVESVDDLGFVNEADLLELKMITKIQARKLIKSWKEIGE